MSAIPSTAAIVLCVLAVAGCGGSGAPAPPLAGPSGTTTTTTAPPSTPMSAHYVGTVATLTQPSAPLDLSLFFNLPPGALSVERRFRLAAVYQVTGGFNTGSGPGGFEGTVEGNLDGTPPNGTFTGVLKVQLDNGCSASRNYSGPLTAQDVNWVAGNHIDTCGGASPLTFSVSAQTSPTSVTTSVPRTPGPVFAVTAAAASVSPGSYSGACPGTFVFSANITTNGPGSVTYRWERSDGTAGQTETLNFTGAGTQAVTNSRQLSANGSFWERVHVLTPNDTSSNDASFTNSCGGFAVTATTASVSPSTYGGACPGTFNFLADITTNGAGSVTYRWERSDGVTGPTQTLTFNAAGTQPAAAASWQLDGNGAFWERVHVLTPNDISSNQATFTNSCGIIPFAVTATTASVSPSTYSGACPGTFNFSGNITTTGAGSVTYQWERSDGVTGPTQTLTFNAAGTQPAAAASWQLGANGAFWERVHVLTPTDITSNQATFTNSCEYPCRHRYDGERESQHLQRRLSGHVQLLGEHHDHWRGQCHLSVGA